MRRRLIALATDSRIEALLNAYSDTAFSVFSTGSPERQFSGSGGKSANHAIEATVERETRSGQTFRMTEGTEESLPKLAAKRRRLVVESDSESGSDTDLPGGPQQRTQNEGMAAEEIKDKGHQDFGDLAVYGHQTDGLGETWDDDDDDEDLGDSAFCAICDDGGHLLFCDGPCMRSFHATKESAGKSAKCRSLGLMEERIHEVESWICPNCKHGQQQCFICGLLGRSEGESKQVYVCDAALCGRFYHPTCLGDWNVGEQFNGIVDPKAFIKSMKEGKGFCCPAHSCRKCGEGEEEGDDNKLAKCRRCPQAFHKHCLPKKISFDERKDMPPRAWDIGGRLLIYCLRHEIEENFKTPARNHLRWPEASSLHRKWQHVNEAPALRQNYQRMTQASSLKQNHRNTSISPALKQSYWKLLEDPSLDREIDMSKNLLRADQNKRPKVVEKEMERTNKFFSVGQKSPTVLLKPYGTLHTRDKAPPTTKFPPRVPSVDFEKRMGSEKKIGEGRPPLKKIFINREGQRTRVSLLMQQAANLVTLEDVKKGLVEPSCYRENQEKNHGHRGEIMSTLHAGRKALDVLRTGGLIEDAKRLFSRDSLIRLLRIERSLGTYLAPFVHGIRYTSFGRHFTNVEKLKEIVNRIHPYIDSGDMVVDFCCGANDFSILLNEKLMSTGKNCEFRNFDIHPPKETFCFTQGDWFKNEGRDFLDGSRLIMGLNPPFGTNASLADQFILHALKFRPKLLILIVPPETMSFTERYKTFKYDLVWVDDKLLKGKAFFIPGSVGEKENENMLQWNNTIPPLYLWSRGDMLRKHKSTALSCGHITDAPENISELHLGREQDQVPPGFGSYVGRPFDEDVSSEKMPHRGSGGWLN